VVNPLPADVLRRKGADVVIAVDPNVADGRKPRAHDGHRRRAWWRRLLSPQMLIDPLGMVRVQMQAMDVGARERTMANLALTDVCVQPGLGAYSTTDVGKLPAILAAGEAAAESALPAIPAALPGDPRPAQGASPGAQPGFGATDTYPPPPPPHPPRRRPPDAPRRRWANSVCRVPAKRRTHSIVET